MRALTFLHASSYVGRQRWCLDIQIVWGQCFAAGFLLASFLAAGSLTKNSLVAVEPELKSVFPLGCQAGTSVEITCAGTGLGKASELYFSRPGLSGEYLEGDRFRVTAAADVPPEDCDLWIATPDGLAGPRRFSISPFAVIAEQEGNDVRESAQIITIPSAVDGRFDKAADLDWFAFEGEAEQLVTITCRSPSLDGSGLPFLTLVGPNGRELIHSSSHEVEPQVSYRLTSQGTYRVLVHDRAYRRDDFSFYRLELIAAAEAPPLQHDLAVLRPDDLFGTISIQDEQSQSREKPQAISLPCRIAGRFVERNEIDWFRFQGRKDQVVHVEAFGARLGQLMDLEATVHNAAGKLVTTAKDLTVPKGAPTAGMLATVPLASLDPAMDWKVPADGEYSVCLRDLYGGSVFGINRRYELIVAAQEPSFFAVAMPANSKPGRGVFVKRGGKAAISLLVVRTGGCDSPVNIRAVDSAPGLTVAPSLIGGKETTKSIDVSVAQDTPPGFYSLHLVAEAKIGTQARTISVVNAVQVRAGSTRRVNEMVIYVTQ